MAVLKVACPKCGQRVSGDESFYGTSVECPVCTSKVVFPENPGAQQAPPIPEKKPEPEVKHEADDSESDPYLPRSESTPIPLLSSSSPQPEPGEGDEHGSPLLGVISMVIGVVTVVCLCLPGILLGPIAVVCGHMGLARARRSRIHPAPGENMALTGLILGYVGMAVFLVYLVILAFPDLPQKFHAWGGGPEG